MKTFYVRAHNIPQFIQILVSKVPIIPITPLYIFFYPMQVKAKRLQQFLLRTIKILYDLKYYIIETYAIYSPIRTSWWDTSGPSRTCQTMRFYARVQRRIIFFCDRIQMISHGAFVVHVAYVNRGVRHDDVVNKVFMQFFFRIGCLIYVIYKILCILKHSLVEIITLISKIPEGSPHHETSRSKVRNYLIYEILNFQLMPLRWFLKFNIIEWSHDMVWYGMTLIALRPP